MKVTVCLLHEYKVVHIKVTFAYFTKLCLLNRRRTIQEHVQKYKMQVIFGTFSVQFSCQFSTNCVDRNYFANTNFNVLLVIYISKYCNQEGIFLVQEKVEKEWLEYNYAILTEQCPRNSRKSDNRKNCTVHMYSIFVFL